MARLATIFTGQWTDLPFEEACRIISQIGYEGVEIACWGDHMDVEKAATDPKYVEERKAILKKYNLQCYALGNHLAGQCTADAFGDPRLAGFAPNKLAGNDQGIRDWGIQQMKYTAQAAKNMGAKVVTGFMGSPIWKYLYSFRRQAKRWLRQVIRKYMTSGHRFLMNSTDAV